MRILLAPMEGLLDYMLRDTLTRFGCHTDAENLGAGRSAARSVEGRAETGAESSAGCGAGCGAGIDACVTEFIRITNTLLPTHSFYRVVPELKNHCRTPAGVPVRVQILGSDPICMAENAAKVARLGALGIDINFGCPANTVNRHRGGAALLKEPELMRTIVHAVRNAVPASIPVTAKMRLGYDSPNSALECAQALSDGGAAEIVVHARTKTDGYKPPAYWEWIAKIREHIPIPVIANGEIWNVDDARRCREISGCADIMIGRGAVANPALALMIRGQFTAELPWLEIEKLLFQFWLTLESQVPECHRHGRIKQWLHYLSRNYPQAQQWFDAIRRLVDPEEIRRILFLELSGKSA